MAQPILTARWSNVCILNFAVAPSLLRPHLPPGLELEVFRGEHYLSLVAFEQYDTQVYGFHAPDFLCFPAIDLRGYVRCGSERGVRLIRRWLPSRVAAWFQQLGFRDPCALAPLEVTQQRSPELFQVRYQLELPETRAELGLVGKQPPLMAPPGSLEHHFKELRWSFGEDRRGDPSYYEIQHPQWFCYPVEDCVLDWDWCTVVGKEWEPLQGRSPRSAVLAVGSEVCLFPVTKLE